MDRPARELEPGGMRAIRSPLKAEGIKGRAQPVVGCADHLQAWGANVKRVNLIDYFDLSEQLGRARDACSRAENKAGFIYFSVNSLRGKLQAFIDDDNGFNTSKHPARELAYKIDEWVDENVMDTSSSPPELDIKKFDGNVYKWSYGDIATKANEFKNVFAAECRDVEVYSVDQVSIYRTASLVANGSHRIPPEYRAYVPNEALTEFDSAGKCLAFDLPTACGFHALRGVELMILRYLSSFGSKTTGLKTWHDYIKAVQDRIDQDGDGPKPSAKVAAMLDRMRDLDRNPLMHPRDTLSVTQADMLFSLTIITVFEMARDVEQHERVAAKADANALVPGIGKVPVKAPAKSKDGKAEIAG